MNTTTNKLIVLIIIFSIPCLFAFYNPPPQKVEKKIKLSEALAHIDGYKVVGDAPLEESIYKFLDLDDYLFRTYEKDGVQITLYIGYYYTADKISAAHTPLACYPAQGWTTSEPEYKQLKVGEHQINYAQIDAILGTMKELVVYWYQSNHDTTQHIYRNKINELINKFVNDHQQHAFVRVSVPQNNPKSNQAINLVDDFVIDFYAQFIQYIDR